MLAPQPIPVSLLLAGLLLEGLVEGGAACFFAGAVEVDEVWPFTSKVWAALIAATTKTETHTPALNAECTILLPDLLLPNLLACGPTDGGRYTPALPSSLRCRNLVNRLRTFEWSQHSLAQNTCQPFSGFRQSNRRSNERPRGNVCAPD